MSHFNVFRLTPIICFAVFASVAIVGSAKSFAGEVTWREQNPGVMVITAFSEIRGSQIEVDLNEDNVEVTIDGEESRIDTDEFLHVQIDVHGSPNADDIRFIGRDRHRLDYFAYLQVYAYDGNDYVANETDNDMWAFGGYGSDVLIGGDGNDHLDSLTTYGEWWGLEDRNDTDILVGGGGSDSFKSRYDFYKSTTNYYVTIDGKKRKISKSQYYEFLRLNRQPFYKRGSTPRYELSTGTGYRYAGAEIAQVLDYEEGELRMAMRLHDGYRYYNYYY